MSIFEYVTVAVSIILGLAIARMLSALTDLFIYKDRVRLHWIPIVWVVTLFLVLITFWWQLFSSGASKEWLYIDFVAIITIAVLFYVASSLLLPRYWTDNEIDLYEFFSATGRWGAAANSAIYFFAIFLDFLLWGIPVASTLTALKLLTFAAGIGAFLSRSVRQAGIWTVAYVLALVALMGYALNPAYSA